MLRSMLLLLVVSLVILIASISAVAETIEGLPSSYVPGSPASFSLRIPAVLNLGSYNIDLLLESNSGVAGTDFYFDVVATGPSTSNYVFASTENFFDAVNVDSASRHRITLSDFDFTGIDVVPNVNDLVAHVVIGTSSTFKGLLELSIDDSGLIFDTPDASPTPVQNFEQVRSEFAALGQITLIAVPEPSPFALLLIGSFAVVIGRRERS